MSVSGITPVSFNAPSLAGGNLLLPGGDDFAGKLQLGQVIKGRVLRQYDGGRYGVEFNGREKIVDSAVPLKTGELLYGKVVGLGEQVELERVRHVPEQAAGEGKEASTPKFWSRGDRTAMLVADLFEQHQVRLSADQTAMIEQSARAAADPKLMALSGIMLSKLGITLAPEWLKIMYDTLRSDAKQGLFELPNKGLALEVQPSSDTITSDAVSPASLAEMAAALKECMEDFSESTLESGNLPETSDPFASAPEQGQASLGQHQEGRDLSRWLMNVQTGGSVSHRVNTTPLLVNGRLLELNIAIFDQHSTSGHQTGPTRHRQLSFSLNSEKLGEVQANLVVTGDHIKMQLGTDRESMTEQLAIYASDLLKQFREDGWTVDRLEYETHRLTENRVAHSVLQHVISQDSTNMLI